LLSRLSLLSTLITRQAHCSDGGDDEPAEHDELAEPAEHDEDTEPTEHSEDEELNEQVGQAELAELAEHAGHALSTLQRWP
jgi:hypothetical protein